MAGIAILMGAMSLPAPSSCGASSTARWAMTCGKGFHLYSKMEAKNGLGRWLFVGLNHGGYYAALE